MTRRDWFLSLLAGGAFLLPACRSKKPGEFSVKGRIHYRGAPLPGGLIVFVPDEDRGNSGSLIKTEIQADGSFTLANTVLPGWYLVAVAPPAPGGASAPTADNPYPAPPARYRNPRLSGLQGEIKPGVENDFFFTLEDATG